MHAPNIGELFQPVTGASVFIDDPCTPDQVGLGTQYRAANCRATLAAAGAISAGSTPSAPLPS